MSIDEACVKCGVCTTVCPVNNITLNQENGKISFGDKCFSCYACIQNCPTNAIHIKSERDASRYRNSHVSLKEIIDSNRQI